jgi:hypothetical protein
MATNQTDYVRTLPYPSPEKWSWYDVACAISESAVWNSGLTFERWASFAIFPPTHGDMYFKLMFEYTDVTESPYNLSQEEAFMLALFISLMEEENEF